MDTATKMPPTGFAITIFKSYVEDFENHQLLKKKLDITNADKPLDTAHSLGSHAINYTHTPCLTICSAPFCPMKNKLY